MLTFDVISKNKEVEYKLNLPTTLSEITSDYIRDVTSNIEVESNYSIVGLIFKEKISTLAFNVRKNKKSSDISVVPVFVKSGATNSDFINNLKIGDKLVISPSDIMLGHHLSTPRNLLTINNVLDIVNGNLDLYNKLISINTECYFIEFKLVPNCNIHGAYKDNSESYINPFIYKVTSSN